jgi:hypothetical protein
MAGGRNKMDIAAKKPRLIIAAFSLGNGANRPSAHTHPLGNCSLR